MVLRLRISGWPLPAGLFTLMFLGAYLDGHLTAVQLEAEDLVIKRWGELQRVPRTKIQKVTWEKGCGVAVWTKDKKWVKIPEIFGYNSQSMTNTIRAWVKKGRPV